MNFDQIKVKIMADYENDVFVSYRRSDDNWVKWTRENFIRPLTTLLRPSLGNVSIYFDDKVETGVSWPNHIALNLARSKLMVAILSRDYFYSDWCRLELALMYDREKENNMRTQQNPFGLIIPVVIDDGDCFPIEVKAMQYEGLHKYANPFICLNSPRQEELAEVIKEKICPVIEKGLDKIPKFDPDWENVTFKKFKDQFKITVQTQTNLPSLKVQANS